MRTELSGKGCTEKAAAGAVLASVQGQLSIIFAPVGNGRTITHKLKRASGPVPTIPRFQMVGHTLSSILAGVKASRPMPMALRVWGPLRPTKPSRAQPRKLPILA